MKALPMWQPWAALVAGRAKLIETRGWPAPATLYGPRFAIHATKGGLSKRDLRALLEDPYIAVGLAAVVTDAPFTRALLNDPGFVRDAAALLTPERRLELAAGLPAGALIATARLRSCVPITPAFADLLARGRPAEHAFGGYSTTDWSMESTRWAWMLEDIVALPEPVPATGHQGIFHVADDLLDAAAQGTLEAT